MVFESARWLAGREGNVPNGYTDFLDTFYARGAGRVLLRVSSETNYEAYVNGRFAGSGQYHDYRERKTYDEIDITALAVPGENRLAVVLYCQHTESSCYTEKGLGLLFEAEEDGRVLCASGRRTLSRLSRDYASGETDLITGQIGYTFSCDLTACDGWREPGASPEGFSESVVIEDRVPMFPRPVARLALTPGSGDIVSQGVFRLEGAYPTLAERLQKAFLSFRAPEELAPGAELSLPSRAGVRLAADGPIYLVVDLGAERAGYFTLDVETEAPSDLYVAFGEHLSDLRVRSYIGGRCFAFSVKLAAGRNRYANRMRRLGARYLMLYLDAPRAVLYNATLERADYPVEAIPRAFASPLLDRIYEVSAETLKLCMHEHYEDTPWREQSLYAMDSRNQMLCGYYVFGEYRFARASLSLLAQSVREDGLLSLCAPMTRDASRLTIMSFSLIWFVQLFEYTRASLDTSLLAEVYDTASRVLDTFRGRVEENGLLANFCRREHWNFYEWTEGSEGNFGEVPEKRYECPLNCFFSLALSAWADTLALCGRDGGAFREEARSVNAAVARHFYERETGRFASYLEADGRLHHYSELTQSLALCCGAAGGRERAAVLSLLTRRDNGLIPVSLSHSIFKYQALLDENDPDTDAFVLGEIERVWGNMLYAGATSFWETADGANAFGRAGSLSHGWSAVPGYVLCRLREDGRL